ncbi:type VII secretion target [Nocardia alni]|uniref:type VII secretion target n=1 Tax=Nocardia alni TaxID=2815723 RepID=UPI001C21589B|nr:type VII secretion target [Nocardia alni]
MADELHADPSRLHELATTFHRTAQAIDAITTNTTTATVAASLAGASIGAACDSGAQTARAAMDLVVGHYSTLYTGTRTSVEWYVTADDEHARRIDVLRRSL